MFRSLKDKLGESLSSGSPVKTLLSTGQQRPSGQSGTNSSAVPSGSFFNSSDLAQNDLTPLSIPRSRTSSISSQASDLSFASPVGMTSEVLDLDGSFSEVETDPTSVMTLNKDELYQMYSKSRQHVRQYKTGYLQVITSYKELEKERDKLKSTLAQTQEKAIRKVSELKERLLVKSEENTDLVKVLQAQINVLNEGKPIPEELRLKSEQLLLLSASSVSVNETSARSDAEALQEKVKRLESLLMKCQETMKNNKEKIQQLTTDRENMGQQLDIKSEEVDRLKDEHKESVALFQNQLKEARRLIQDLETDKVMSVATMKQEFHTALEAKDSELTELNRKVNCIESDNIRLKEEIKNLTKTGEEQLQKSRDIIKKLKAEKNQLEEETREKLEISEQNLELEKDSELQELRRGKVEALQVLKQQMQDKVEELKEEKEIALKERDKEWEEKLLRRDQAKMKELEATLTDRQEEMMLAIEEQQLQKIAAVKQCDLAASDLKTQCETLTQDKKELEIRLESFQVETLSKVKSLEEEIQITRDFGDLKLQEIQSSHDLELEKVRESCETKYNKKIEDLQVEFSIKAKDLTSNYEQRLAESQVAADARYESLLNDWKGQDTALCDDSQKTISRLQNEMQALDAERAELKMKISELETQVSAEKEICERYSAQLEELDSRAMSDRDSFQLRLKGLIERIDHQSNSMESLIAENNHLHAELGSIQAKSNESIAAMRKEMENLCQTTAQKLIDANRASADIKNCVSNTGHAENVEDTSVQSSDTKAEQEAQAVVLEELGVDELRAQIQKLRTDASSVNALHIQQIASSIDTIRTLEQRISDLIDRENHLNVELEQSKMENERNLASHNSDMLSLRSKIEELRSSEQVLKDQVRVANEHCEAELGRASMENISALSQFSGLLTESQKEMSYIIQELMETKERSNKIVASLEEELQEKCIELEHAYQCITELGGEVLISAEQNDDITNPAADQIEVDNASLNFATGDHMTMFDRQNFDEGISSDKGLSNLESGDAACEKESITQLQDRQEMLPPISGDLFSAGELTPEDLLKRTTELENSLAEKDQKIFWFESKVKEFGNQIQHETKEMRMRSQQVEFLMADKDDLLKEKDEVTKTQIQLIKDLETKLQEQHSVIFKKSSDFNELQSKFWQLQGEAKSRIMNLKKRLLEEGGDKTDVPERIKQLQEEFAFEMAEVHQVHETEIKILAESLVKEQQSMIFFKENVKKQFEENQEKVKFMIEQLRDGCEQSLMDRDHLYQIKLMNLERDKNTEKDKAVQDLTVIIEKLRDEQKMPQSEMTLKQSEEVGFLKAELESLKVCHREAVLRFQSEKDAILRHAAEGNEHLWEKMKELEQSSTRLSGFGGSLPDNNGNETKFTLEVEFEKLSTENRALHMRIADLEKQRNAIMEMARDIRIDQGGDAMIGMKVRDSLNDLEGKVDTLEQREELKRLKGEVAAMMEKILLQEQHEKEVVEKLEAEKKEAGIGHAAAVVEWEKKSQLRDADVIDLNRQISQSNDIIKCLNEKVLNLEELEIESRKKSKEIGELADINKQNEVAITSLNEKIFELEEKRVNPDKNKCSFPEHIKALKSQSDIPIDKVTMSFNASQTESEETTPIKIFNEKTAKSQMTQEKLDEKEKEFERETNTEENRNKCLLYEHADTENLDLDSQNRVKVLSHKLNSVTQNIVQLEQVVAECRQREEEYRSTAEMYKSELEESQQQLKVVEGRLKEFEISNNGDDQSTGEIDLSAEAIVKRLEDRILNIKQEHVSELERLNLEWQTRVDGMQLEKRSFLKSKDCGSEVATASEIVAQSDCISEERSFNEHATATAFVELSESPTACNTFDGISVERVENRIHKVVLPVVEILPATMNISVGECSDSPVLELHEQEMEQFRVEQKSTVQRLEDEHNLKVIQLIKDFNVQMVEREQQIKEKFQKEIESLQKTEARLLSDHREQTRELHQQISERNERLEEIVRNCEAQIQTSDERHGDHIDKLNQIIQDLQETLVDKEHEWVMSRGEAVILKDVGTSLKTHTATLQSSNDTTQISLSVSSADSDLLRNKVVRLESELQELKEKHSVVIGQLSRRLERYEMGPLSPLLPGMNHKDSLVALGGDDVFQLLELQNSHLEAEVNRHLIEIARLREREKDLLHELELRFSSFHSGAASAATVLGSLLMEPTEMEYLKNVLYNYMIGLETKTLAKVICTVVKFSDDQTRLILEKEETKSSKQASQQASSTAAMVGGRPPSTRRLALQKSPPPVNL